MSKTEIYSYEVDSTACLKGETPQDLEKFFEKLSALTQEQIDDYVAGKKLFEFCNRKQKTLNRLIKEYEPRYKKPTMQLKADLKHLQQTTEDFVNNLQKEIKSESYELYWLSKNIKVIDDIQMEGNYAGITVQLTITVDVECEYEPYTPATLYSPPEGGWHISEYDAYGVTAERLDDLIKILNMYPDLDFEVIDYDGPSEESIYQDIAHC